MKMTGVYSCRIGSDRPCKYPRKLLHLHRVSMGASAIIKIKVQAAGNTIKSAKPCGAIHEASHNTKRQHTTYTKNKNYVILDGTRGTSVLRNGARTRYIPITLGNETNVGHANPSLNMAKTKERQKDLTSSFSKHQDLLPTYRQDSWSSW